jgi:aspartyl-tRNA(Asn)/glutamyl-tRNA(Gln) amidotransferase subunit A
MASLGTDTMGSVRIPASYCGVVGLKPTFGLASAAGVVPTYWPWDAVGPLARTVEDAAIMLDGIAGYDAESPGSRPTPKAAFWPVRKIELTGYRFSILRNLVAPVESPAILEAFKRAVEVFRRLGARPQEETIPDYVPTTARRQGFLIVEAVAAFLHKDVLAAKPESFSRQVLGYLQFGRDVSSARLLHAQCVLEGLRHSAQRLFERTDFVLSPATPQTSFRFGEPVPDTSGDLAALANFGGCPAISVPMGFDKSGMPMGLQIVGAPGADSALLSVASAFESSTDFRLKSIQ